MDNSELRELLAKLDEHSDGDYLSRLANGACIASDCANLLREHGARLLADSDALQRLRAEIAGARVEAIDASCMVIVHSDMIGQRVALLRLPAGESQDTTTRAQGEGSE